MNYSTPNPVLSAGGVNANAYNNYYSNQYLNPTTRLTIEQQNYLNQQQQQQYYQSDPYASGISLLNQCSDLVKTKIMQDQRYVQADNECELLIKQYIYSNVIPQILNSQQGRIAFEKWENCIKTLKEEYAKEEVAVTQNMQALLNDPVILARLQEMQQAQQMQQDIIMSDTDEPAQQAQQQLRQPIKQARRKVQQQMQQGIDRGGVEEQ